MKCKSLLREKVYWYGLDKDVESKIASCIPCQANNKLPSPTPIKMSELPTAVWSEIAIDFFGPTPTGEKLVVLIDLYSRFPLIEVMNTTSVFSVISRLESVFSIFGYPDRCRHDNGPPFGSHEFINYFKEANIKNNSTTPYYPQSNGVVENINKILNKAMRTAKFENKNWRNVLSGMLLNYRCSPHATTGRSPSQIFFGRNINNGIPLIKRETSQFDEEIRQRQTEIYGKTKKYIDTKRKPKLSVFKVGDDVIMKRTKKSCKSDSKFYNNIFTVVKVNGSNITVQKSTGERYTRNISFFKTVCIKPDDENKIIDEKEKPFMNTEKFRKTYPKRNRKVVFGNYHLK